jgi:hypothetical protein
MNINQVQVNATEQETDHYNASISVSLWSSDDEANDVASDMADAVMEAIRGAIEEFDNREGVGLSINISETQSVYQPRAKQYNVQLQQEVITGDLDEEDSSYDKRQMQFPFE